MQPNEWTPPPIPAVQPAATPPRRRRGLVLGAGLVGAGVVAGAIVGGTVLSNAATTTPTPGSSSSATQPQYGHGHGRMLDLSGTVTAVGSSSVTIRTSSGTTTYQVDSNSDIDKHGEAQLSSLKAGDAVRFSVRSGNVIAVLHAGNEALNLPQGPHGHRGMLNLSGTVTAVGSSSVTIRTSSGTTTYQVDSNSDIDKNGEAQLSSLKAGDAVRFSVRSGNVIAVLHAGNEALDHPQGPGPGNDSGG